MKIKQKKRFIALLAVAVLILSLAACGRGRQDGTMPPVITTPIPVETEPVETEPLETEPLETEPLETESLETEPLETEPAETEPAEPETTETEHVETEPAETEPLCEHKFYPNAKTVIPTCKAEGYTEYTCKLCGEKVQDDFKPAVAHLYVHSIIEYASCTSNGLEAMVCTYCGETDKDAYPDDSVIHKGIITFDEPITVDGVTKNILAEEDFYNKVFLPDENEMFWVNFNVKPIELSDFTSAEGGSTLFKFQIGKNVHRIMLRAFRVDDKTVKLACQDNEGKNTELSGVTLTEGETYNFVIEYETKAQKYNIYVNDEMVGSNSIRLDYGASEQYQLYVGSSGKWEFSDIEIFNSSHSFEPVYREYRVVEAYGHSYISKFYDTVTLTHHQVEVSECESCGEIFEARGVKGAEHSFTLVERVADQETAMGFKTYGYEVFKCDCGYVLTVSANHEDGHFYNVDIYTGKYKCRCGSVYVGEFDKAHNGNEDAGVVISGKGETNE